ncbi:MAG: hypothetical protein M1836_005485 [Candelina mexicana]|nr:MAG: hypothetical protein M1836_005485 [Candelina mexicana]
MAASVALKPFPFLKLPGELRNRVYFYAFAPTTADGRWQPNVTLLRTSGQVCHESYILLYSSPYLCIRGSVKFLRFLKTIDETTLETLKELRYISIVNDLPEDDFFSVCRIATKCLSLLRLEIEVDHRPDGELPLFPMRLPSLQNRVWELQDDGVFFEHEHLQSVSVLRRGPTRAEDRYDYVLASWLSDRQTSDELSDDILAVELRAGTRLTAGAIKHFPSLILPPELRNQVSKFYSLRIGLYASERRINEQTQEHMPGNTNASGLGHDFSVGDYENTASEPFPFLRLPPELRNKVYEHALLLDEPVIFTWKLEADMPNGAFLRASRQIYNEALPIYYRNTFLFADVYDLMYFLVDLTPVARDMVNSVNLTWWLDEGCAEEAFKMLCLCKGLKALRIRIPKSALYLEGTTVYLLQQGKEYEIKGMAELRQLRGIESFEIFNHSCINPGCGESSPRGCWKCFKDPTFRELLTGEVTTPRAALQQPRALA